MDQKTERVFGPDLLCGRVGAGVTIRKYAGIAQLTSGASPFNAYMAWVSSETESIRSCTGRLCQYSLLPGCDCWTDSELPARFLGRQARAGDLFPGTR